MAVEADCGSSTVLEKLRVASTFRSLVPGERRPPCTQPLAVDFQEAEVSVLT